MQGQLDQMPWSTMSITGYDNRVVFLNGGGNYNVYPPAGQPISAHSVSTVSNRNAFSTNAIFDNRLTCKYNITSPIPAGGLLKLYAYSSVTDGFTNAMGVTGASNNISVIAYPNSVTGNTLGLVFEGGFDNNANVPNEIILFFRNITGQPILAGSGFFDFILTVGL